MSDNGACSPPNPPALSSAQNNYTGGPYIYLERALALEPRACPVLSELGSAYLDLARIGPAIDELQRCLAMEPNNYSALVNLGDAYIARDDPSDARPLFQRANRGRPDGPEAIIDLGHLEDVDGHWQAAVADYLKALAIQPLALDAYGNLGYDYNVHLPLLAGRSGIYYGLEHRAQRRPSPLQICVSLLEIQRPEHNGSARCRA